MLDLKPGRALTSQERYEKLKAYKKTDKYHEYDREYQKRYRNVRKCDESLPKNG